MKDKIEIAQYISDEFMDGKKVDSVYKEDIDYVIEYTDGSHTKVVGILAYALEKGITG